MATEKENLDKIRAITSHGDLLKLWDAHVKDEKTLIDWAKGKFLEYAVLRAFELEQEKQKAKLGFNVGHISYPFIVRYP